MSQPSDPPRRGLVLQGRRLSFSEEGAGAPILALHGLPGSGRDFRWFAPALEGRARLIRVDLPGFGESEPIDGLDLLAQAEHLALLVKALELDRPLLVGHSFGGPLAVALAGLLPVRGLALLASVGLRPHRGYRSVPAPKQIGPLSSWPLLGPALVSASSRAMLRFGFSRHTTREEVGLTLRLLGRFDFAAHAARVRALAVPTLIAWAEDDPLIETEISVELAAACPDGPRLVFAEGGHNVQKSQAAALAEAILELAGGPRGQPAIRG